MSERRIEPEDLGGLEEVKSGDPRREALESQPRARAQLRAYRDFVAPGEAPEGARLPEAQARLRKVLEEETGVSLDDPAPDESAPRARPARAPRRRAAGGAPGRGGGFFGALLAPRLRPALALAALVGLLGGVWLVTATRRDGEAPVLRGSSPAVSEDDLAAKPAQRLAGGALRLEWSGTADAEQYAVVFLATDLTEIARVEHLTSTHFDLEPGGLPAGLVSSQPALWRVIALRGPDELARSQAQAITVP